LSGSEGIVNRGLGQRLQPEEKNDQ